MGCNRVGWPQQQVLYVVRGDEYVDSYKFVESDGTPIDLTLATEINTDFRVSADAPQSLATLTLGSGYTITDAPNGVVARNIDPMKTRDLENGCVWDCEILFSNQGPFTWVAGKVALYKDVSY